jgi:hypothetical protein
MTGQSLNIRIRWNRATKVKIAPATVENVLRFMGAIMPTSGTVPVNGSTMSLSDQYVTELSRGPVYSFADWPNPSVPAFGAGVYTIWHNDGRFIYVCMSGRGITAETVAGILPKAFIHGSEAMPADVAAAISSASTWRIGLFYRPYLSRTLLLSPQGGTKWMHSCADTSMRTFPTVS